MTAAFVAHLGWTLLHFVWQGALIAGVAGLGLAALRNSRPETRYALACIALLACLAWPAIDLAARLHAPAVSGHAGAMARFGAGAAALPAWAPLDWLRAHVHLVVLAWAVGAALLALRMAAGLCWIGQAARGVHGDPGWQARLSVLAVRMGITRAVRLRLVEALASPVTALWWRPVVLLPASLLTGLPPALLDALLAHELAHVRRADYLVNLAQNVIETLLFYHPAVWWLSRTIRTEREWIADDLAAQLVGGRHLALALSALERHQCSQHDLALAANGGNLMTRITRLLRPAQPNPGWHAAAPILGVAAVLALGCAQAPVTEPLKATTAATTSATTAATATATTTPAVVQFATCARPVYPQPALRAKRTGTVGLGFLVGTDGKVRDTRVERSSGDAALDDAARLAIAKCTFTPARENGVAVQRWAPVQYVWALQ